MTEFKTITPELIEAAWLMRKQGATTMEVAKAFSVDHDALTQAFVKRATQVISDNTPIISISAHHNNFIEAFNTYRKLEHDKAPELPLKEALAALKQSVAGLAKVVADLG
jgi:hypothetical protein